VVIHLLLELRTSLVQQLIKGKDQVRALLRSTPCGNALEAEAKIL